MIWLGWFVRRNFDVNVKVDQKLPSCRASKTEYLIVYPGVTRGVMRVQSCNMIVYRRGSCVRERTASQGSWRTTELLLDAILGDAPNIGIAISSKSNWRLKQGTSLGTVTV